MRPYDVRVMRRGDIDRVNIVARQKRGIIFTGCAAMQVAKFLCPRRRAACDACQCSVMAVFKVAGESVGNAAGR